MTPNPLPSIPTIAVVVLNWNGLGLLRKFVPLWIEQTSQEGVDLIIVDNHSDDESVAYLNQNYPEVKQIQFEKNWGFAEGYNKAIEALHHDIVVLLNSDACLSEGWYQSTLGHLKDESVWALQPKLRAYNEPELFEYAGAAGGFIDVLGYPYCRGRILSTIEPDQGQYDSSINIDWATGACLIIRREKYLDCGGLDADFFAHQEEIDLCWRIRARGGCIRCAGDMVAYHIGGASLQMNSPRKVYLNYRNNLLMLYKNVLSAPKLSLILFVRFFLDYLSAFVFLLQGQKGLFIAVYKARRDFWRMLPLFRRKRKENKELSQFEVSPKLTSILWSYYLRGKKHYSQIFP